MGFSDDLSEYLDPFLHLTIRGKVWDIPTASAIAAVRLQQLMHAGGMTAEDEAREALRLFGATWKTETVTIPVMFDPKTGKLMGTQLTDDEDQPVFRHTEIGGWSGDLYDEMSAAGISHDEIEIAANTLLSHTVFGLQAAEHYWDSRRNAPRPPDADSQDSEGNQEPPQTGANRATRRTKKAPAKAAAKKPTPKKRTSSKANTGSTTRGPAPTAKPTPAEPTTTP